MNKAGHFEKGRWIPASTPPQKEQTIIVNLNVQGLEEVERVVAQMEKAQRLSMGLDDTFTQQGFNDVPEKEQPKGVMNRVKNAGKVVWRAVTCPFQK